MDPHPIPDLHMMFDYRKSADADIIPYFIELSNVCFIPSLKVLPNAVAGIDDGM